jgi:TRAP-type C4-dicarboxylate transport system permease small subunit
MRGIEKAAEVLGRIESALVVLALAAVFLGILGGVAVRLLDLPVPNPGEIAVVAMSPLTFVGAALCAHLGRHIRVEVGELLPSARARLILTATAEAAVGLFAAFFAALAWGFFAYALRSGERLIDLGVPVAVPVGFMLAGAGLLLVHSLVNLARAAAAWREAGAA